MYSQTLPCLAECGGFMYLHEEMEYRDGIARRMCGVIPADQSVKAHEFQYWNSDSNRSDWIASKKGAEYPCVVDNGTLLAGYPHFYYYSNPGMAAGFLRRCVQYRNS